MAKVYLADQESLDREVALKVMSSELVIGDESFCRRFLKEGQIIAKLHHQHIVTIHDIGCTLDKVYYMAMEYCPGGTLKEKIKSGMAVPEVISIVRQVATALGFAHSKGFVHRDIKPGNILFRDNDEAVLSDFGIAKTLEGDRTQLTQVGYAVGTPEYMSPEQATGSHLSAGSDLYSLGVVMYEMLLGEKPYSSSDAVSAVLMHVQKPIPLLPSEFAGLQHIVDGLMAKQMSDRISSADELIKELDMLQTARPAVLPEDLTQVLPRGTQPSKTTHRPTPDTASRKGNTANLILAGLGLLVFISALVLGYRVLNKDQGYVAIESSTTVSPSDVTPEDSKVDQERVAFLLEVAQAHMAIGRIREPAGSNALEAYRMILEIDPQNREAIEALQQIADLPGVD